MSAYRVLIGINYGDRRAEPGEIVNDLPDGDLSWLVEGGAIEPVEPELAAQRPQE